MGEPEQATITISSDTVVTMESKPEILMPGFIRLTDWRGELCSIDATFDLSDVPPELVNTAVGLIQGSGTRLHLGDMVRPRPPKGGLDTPDGTEGGLSVTPDEAEAEPKEHVPLWRRMLGRRHRG